MNKAELIAALAARNSLGKPQIEVELKALADIVAETLKKGEEVTLPGIGKLKPHTTAARQGRNPKTGETIQIPEKKSVKLSVAKELKDAIADVKI